MEYSFFIAREEIQKELTQTIQKLFPDAYSTIAKKKSKIPVYYPPNLEYGDYASPILIELKQILNDSLSTIANSIKEVMLHKNQSWIDSIQETSNGFLNFTLKKKYFVQAIQKNICMESILSVAEQYVNKNESYLIEFVSANPTGPLNIVSARSATVGDCLCRILKKMNIPVQSEYYINDYGKQIYLLGLSLAYRYLQILEYSISIPTDCYQGDYIYEICKSIINNKKFPFAVPQDPIGSILESKNWQSWLNQASSFFGSRAIEIIIHNQKKTLEDYKVFFDNFYYESNLHQSNKVNSILTELQKTKFCYKNEGAWYLKTTEFSDEKDRVLVRGDGNPTYFLSDIAYHENKFNRGFTKLINILGPDHHGYIKRLKASLKILKLEQEKEDKCQTLIVQQVNLYDNGKKNIMSKRKGSFITLNELIQKIPVDICRFFFIMRSQNSHLDFDIQLAQERSEKNPLYYIQYTHARIHSIFRQNKILYKNFSVSEGQFSDYINLTKEKTIRNLIAYLIRFPEEAIYICQNYDINRLPVYILKLSKYFTTFYHQKDNNIKIVHSQNIVKANFLLVICKWTAECIRTGLELLGIKALTSM